MSKRWSASFYKTRRLLYQMVSTPIRWILGYLTPVYSRLRSALSNSRRPEQPPSPSSSGLTLYISSVVKNTQSSLRPTTTSPPATLSRSSRRATQRDDTSSEESFLALSDFATPIFENWTSISQTSLAPMSSQGPEEELQGGTYSPPPISPSALTFGASSTSPTPPSSLKLPAPLSPGLRRLMMLTRLFSQQTEQTSGGRISARTEGSASTFPPTGSGSPIPRV